VDQATFGATEAEARRLVRERQEAIDFERGRAQVADMLGGDVDLSAAKQLDDAIEERFRAGVLDVLSLNGLASDRQHDFIVNGLLPILRSRGIVKPDYVGSTLRENLGLPLPHAAILCPWCPFVLTSRAVGCHSQAPRSATNQPDQAANSTTSVIKKHPTTTL